MHETNTINVKFLLLTSWRGTNRKSEGYQNIERMKFLHRIKKFTKSNTVILFIAFNLGTMPTYVL